MKVLFKNVTKYNKKNYEQFLQFHNKKFGFSYNFYTIIMSILLIVCIVFSANEKNILFVFMFLIILIAFLLFRLYFPMKKHEKTEKQYKANKENLCTYSFYDWYFTLNEQTFYYFKLFKVFETKDYFYLYINDENAALVSKNGFQKGSTKEFSEFIKKKCLLKYSKQK